MDNKILILCFFFLIIFTVAGILLFPLVDFNFSVFLGYVISSLLTYGLMRLFIKIEESRQILITKFIIRSFGVLLILSALPVALMFSFGRMGRPPVEYSILMYSLLGLFITAFGIAALMKWSWYSAIILLPICVTDGVYFMCHSNTFAPGYFLQTLGFPSLLFFFLLIPKVRSEFR